MASSKSFSLGAPMHSCCNNGTTATANPKTTAAARCFPEHLRAEIIRKIIGPITTAPNLIAPNPIRHSPMKRTPSRIITTNNNVEPGTRFYFLSPSPRISS
jgi:hypothetical protein